MGVLLGNGEKDDATLIFGPGRATLVYNTIPLFAVVLSVIFLGEILMPYQIAGGVVVIAGVIIGTKENALKEEL